MLLFLTNNSIVIIGTHYLFVKVFSKLALLLKLNQYSMTVNLFVSLIVLCLIIAAYIPICYWYTHMLKKLKGDKRNES